MSMFELVVLSFRFSIIIPRFVRIRLVPPEQIGKKGRHKIKKKKKTDEGVVVGEVAQQRGKNFRPAHTEIARAA